LLLRVSSPTAPSSSQHLHPWGQRTGMIAEKRALLRQSDGECQENPRQSRASTLFAHPTVVLGGARPPTRTTEGGAARPAARTHGWSGSGAVPLRKCTISGIGLSALDASFVQKQSL